MMRTFRKRVYKTLISNPSGNTVSRYVNLFIVVLIFLSVIFIIVETSRQMREENGWFFEWFEFFAVFVFTIEYILRLWSCVEDKNYRSPVLGRLRFAFRPLVIIDLIAIIPFYLPFIFSIDLVALRSLRLLRILRIFKLTRYHSAMGAIGRVLYKTKEELLVTLFAGFLLLVIASTLMYYVENPVQPEMFSSIPASMWCVVATLTTVGYGDIYPITVTGQILASVMALLGVGMFALPAGILGSAFLEEVQQENDRKHQCPKCKHRF
ncbi:Potassium voltage-gated channel subfamily KQT; possible potassium channel, VIC family [hydrothermal vent metagenome]|uniref:Potassium voltage-gated channel subfamily KQT possible potassium channel, VIC family n=1 Tax=hydrothermal vent metagenome TaxID=652676 RepID=A0A3B1CAI9_9ZZZZ